MDNPSRLLHRVGAPADVWLVSVGSVVVTLGIKLALGPITADAPLLLFFGAVIVSAWLGGFRAGVLATLLSAVVADFELTPPHWQFQIGTAWALRLLLFIGEGVFISAAAQSRVLRAPGAARAAADRLPGQGWRDGRPVRMSALVREVTASMQEEASAKDVYIETVIDHGTGAVEGDSDGLRQIVASLLHNAIRFTPAGGRVCVRVRRRRHQVELSVLDTGQGIAEQDLEGIFLASAADPGSLAHVRQQVRLHGGEMTVYSAGPGTGATVTVRLRRLLFAPAAREPEHQLAV